VASVPRTFDVNQQAGGASQLIDQTAGVARRPRVLCIGHGLRRGDDASEPRVRLAAGLADGFGAMLIGLSALAAPPPMVAAGMVMDEPTDVDIELIRAKLADKGSWFRGIAGGDRRRFEWRRALVLPTRCSHARPGRPISSSSDRRLCQAGLPGDRSWRAILKMDVHVDCAQARWSVARRACATQHHVE
jgi:hypothetical protein